MYLNFCIYIHTYSLILEIRYVILHVYVSLLLLNLHGTTFGFSQKKSNSQDQTTPGAKLSFGAFRAVRTGGDRCLRQGSDQGPVLRIQGTAWYISLLIYHKHQPFLVGKYTIVPWMTWDQMEPIFWGDQT